MGVKYFIESSQGTMGAPVFECKDTISDGVAGNIFLLPDNAGKITNITIQFNCINGSGYIKGSGSNREDIKRNNATWGNLTAKISNEQTTFAINPVTAIRLVRVSGTISMECTAQ